MTQEETNKRNEAIAEENKYYIISLKWTSKYHAYITLWRTSSNGYCWYKDWAGTYKESDKRERDILEGSIYIEKSIVDQSWTKVHTEYGEKEVLFNNLKTRKKLGIKASQFWR